MEDGKINFITGWTSQLILFKFSEAQELLTHSMYIISVVDVIVVIINIWVSFSTSAATVKKKKYSSLSSCSVPELYIQILYDVVLVYYVCTVYSIFVVV